MNGSSTSTEKVSREKQVVSSNPHNRDVSVKRLAESSLWLSNGVRVDNFTGQPPPVANRHGVDSCNIDSSGHDSVQVHGSILTPSAVVDAQGDTNTFASSDGMFAFLESLHSNSFSIDSVVVLYRSPGSLTSNGGDIVSSEAHTTATEFHPNAMSLGSTGLSRIVFLQQFAPELYQQSSYMADEMSIITTSSDPLSMALARCQHAGYYRLCICRLVILGFSIRGAAVSAALVSLR